MRESDAETRSAAGEERIEVPADQSIAIAGRCREGLTDERQPENISEVSRGIDGEDRPVRKQQRSGDKRRRRRTRHVPEVPKRCRHHEAPPSTRSRLPLTVSSTQPVASAQRMRRTDGASETAWRSTPDALTRLTRWLTRGPLEAAVDEAASTHIDPPGTSATSRMGAARSTPGCTSACKSTSRATLPLLIDTLG